jgi:hypothetical protein
MDEAKYRANLEAILAFTGGKHWLKQKQVADYLGVSRQTASRRYGPGISAETLARELAADEQ